MFDLARIGAGLPVAETLASLPESGYGVLPAPAGPGGGPISSPSSPGTRPRGASCWAVANPACPAPITMQR